MSITRPKIVGSFETLSIVLLMADVGFTSTVSWTDLLVVPPILWVILSVSRRGSRRARWVLTAFYAVGMGVTAYLAASRLLPIETMNVVGWAVNLGTVAQFILLWSPPMSEWIKANRDERDTLA